MGKVISGDALTELRKLPDESIDMCVTSPPYYGLRDYGVSGQIGLEDTPNQYIDRLTEVFRQVRRVLRPQGTLWLNIGDSYWGSGSRGFDFTDLFTSGDTIQKAAKGTYDNTNMPRLVGDRDGYKNKDLIGIPWMLAFALRSDGWYLRQDIIWHKPNPMPESVTDRCTKAHEYIFLLSKSPKYYFDYEAIQEHAKTTDPGKIKFGGNKYGDNEDKHYAIYSGNEWKPRTKNTQYDGQKPNTFHLNRENGGKDKEYIMRNKRDVWSVNVQPTREAHFATFPEKLIEPCILAGCPVGGVVLDPFFGSGTTGIVATKLNREYIGIELNPEYIEIINRRTSNIQLTLTGMAEGL